MYKEPIRVNSGDPMTSVSAIEGTVIGILFEKSGSEIKTAMQSRIKNIDDKIANHDETIKTIDSFLRQKEEEIKKIDLFKSERGDARSAECKPFDRQVEEIQRQIDEVERKKEVQLNKFDDETDKEVANRAVDFEKGFDDIREKLYDIDALLRDDPTLREGGPCKGRIRGYGETGPQGMTGPTGAQGYTGNNSNCYTVSSNGSAGMGTVNPDSTLVINNDGSSYYYSQEDRDRAAARIYTLRSMVREYRNKLDQIKQAIADLQEEKRRLNLMFRNIDDKRVYKLDLNKLSAFGFEDIEIA